MNSLCDGEIILNNAQRILVTGFLPFNGEKINPSEILLDWIKKDFSALGVETLLLPVSFQSAPLLVENKLKETDFEHILMLGQAGGRHKVSLERVALNWTETVIPDENNFQPVMGKISDDGPEAIFTQAPVEVWKSELLAHGHPVEISLSAGGYVCNHLYFKTLQMLKAEGHSSKACFVHVPYLPEQIVGKPPHIPSMDFTTMQSVLYWLLNDILKK